MKNLLVKGVGCPHLLLSSPAAAGGKSKNMKK